MGDEDQRQQQADEEQSLHECLDAAQRLESMFLGPRFTGEFYDEQCRVFRQDLETIARYAQVLQYLHKPLR